MFSLLPQCESQRQKEKEQLQRRFLAVEQLLTVAWTWKMKGLKSMRCVPSAIQARKGVIPRQFHKPAGKVTVTISHVLIHLND